MFSTLSKMLSWSAFNQYFRTIFFPSHWLPSHITIVETMDSNERGMNPVAMTIINPRKEYWPSRGSNQRPPVLKFATLPTELWGSAFFFPVRMSLKSQYLGLQTIECKISHLSYYKSESKPLFVHNCKRYFLLLSRSFLCAHVTKTY